MLTFLRAYICAALIMFGVSSVIWYGSCFSCHPAESCFLVSCLAVAAIPVVVLVIGMVAGGALLVDYLLFGRLEKEKIRLAPAQARYVSSSSALGRENPGHKAFFRAFGRK